MKYLWRIKTLVYLLLIYFTSQSYAYAYDNFLVNKKSCLASPSFCLKQIHENIKSINKHSTVWFRLINFKLLAIWEIRDVERLKKEIHQYIHLNDAPPIFLTTVYTMHAKMLFSDGNIEEGNEYAEKAVALIKKVNIVSFDADRYAEILILYIQFNQYENVEKFIMWVNNRIEKMGPPQYFPKLQTALAHAYFNFSDYDLALKHYQFALTGFIETDYSLETAEGYHNVARALQGKKEYNQAVVAFKKALKWMDSAVTEGNYSIEAKNYTQLRLIETLQQSAHPKQAKLLLEEIKPNQVDTGSLTLFRQLKGIVVIK